MVAKVTESGLKAYIRLLLLIGAPKNRSLPSSFCHTPGRLAGRPSTDLCKQDSPFSEKKKKDEKEKKRGALRPQTIKVY